MRRLLTALVVASVFAGGCGAELGSPSLVVGLGDSTPAGFGVGSQLAFPVLYGELLAEELGIEVHVVNHATGRTRTVMEWAELVSSDDDLRGDLEAADIVVVWMGWHDIIPLVYFASADDWPDPLRGQLIAKNTEMAIAWGELFETIRTLAPDAVVLVADTALVGFLPERFGSEPFWPDLEELTYLDWRRSLTEAAAEHDAVVVPTWAALQDEGESDSHPELSSPDGLHFNEDGQRFLAELFRRHDGIGAG